MDRQMTHSADSHCLKAGLLPRCRGLCLFVIVIGVAWLCGSSTTLHAEAIDAPVPEQQAVGRLLELGIEDLMNVTVTSVAKKEQPLSKTAAAVFVITGEDIRRGGFRSIPEALRLAPGVQVAQVNANQWAITIRGFNSPFSNKLLVLIDGRAVYTPAFGGVFWDVQDTLMEDIDRIEVVRGPGGTLWGQNAVNGVINVITKQARRTQGAYVEAGGGNLEQGFTSVRQGGTLGEQGEYRIYGKYFNRAGYDRPGGSPAPDDWSQARGGFRTDWRFNGGDSLTVQGDGYSGNQNNELLGVSLTQPFAFKAPSSTRVGGGNLLARWTRTFSNTSDLRLQTYVDRTQRAGAFVSEDRTTVDVDVQHRFQFLDRHDIVWGGQYQSSRENFTNNFRIALSDSDIFQVASGFVQDEITLMRDRLKFIVGTKILHNSFTGMEYQPNGRLLWTPAEHHTLWASVSRAVRLPTFVDRTIRLNAAATAISAVPNTVLTAAFGNPNQLSEEVVAYEVGYRTQILPTLSFDLAGYYNVYRRLSTIIPGGTPSLETNPAPAHILNPLSFTNSGAGHSYGAEVTAVWQAAKPWRLTANYSWLAIESSSLNQLNVASNPSLNPEHQFRIRSQYDLPFQLQWDTGVYYTSALTLTDVPSYTRVDTRLAWRPTEQWEAEIVGQNLFEKDHVEWYPVGAGAVFNNSAIPRSVFVRLSWRY